MVDLKRLQVSKTRSLIVTRHFVRRGVGVMDGSCGSSVEASHVLYTMSFTVTRHGACWLVIVACGGSWSWAWVAPRKKVNTATLSEARRKYILASLNSDGGCRNKKMSQCNKSFGSNTFIHHTGLSSVEKVPRRKKSSAKKNDNTFQLSEI